MKYVSAIIIVALLILSSCESNQSKLAKEDKCWSYIGETIELRKQKNYQGALQKIELHNNCDKSVVRMSYFYQLGWTYYEMGEFNKAVNAFTNGLKTQPNFAFAYWRRGLAYEMLGESLKADNDYKKAYDIGINGKDPEEFLETLEKNPEVKAKLVK